MSPARARRYSSGMNRLLIVVAVLASLLLTAQGRAGEPVERWYVLQMQGQRAGWMHERITREGGNIRSRSGMKIEIKRGQIRMAITVDSEFIETQAGKPVTMSSSMTLGAMPTGKKYTFVDGAVEIEETAMGQVKPKVREPLPEGDWMTPRAAERHFADRIAAGDETVIIKSIDPSVGARVVTSTHTLVERTKLDVVGRTIPALKWKTTLDLYPGITSDDFTDQQGRAVRSEIDIGGIKMLILLADKDLALAKLDPPELLESTLIRLEKPIPQARTTRRATYKVTSNADRLADIPTLGAQRFERTGDRAGRVVVDLNVVAPAEAADVANQEYRDCSTMISCGDQDVQSLLKRALGDGAPEGKAARAEALRRFVYKFIDKKSLDVGFASAAEVADTAAGDCSEHGVLLCALLRADGIPSRVISGIVYVDGFSGQTNVFGYHMWTQALLDDGSGPKWVDLDAAIDREHAFDATHIALAASSLSEKDMTNSLVQLAPALGTLDIKVETVE